MMKITMKMTMTKKYKEKTASIAKAALGGESDRLG